VLRRPREGRSGERGVVLVVVLWAFMFLFVLGMEFSAEVREEGSAAVRFAEETEGYYAALAAYHAGLYEALKALSEPGRPQSDDLAFLLDEGCREGSLGQTLYRFCLEDEGGKINLNAADEATLRGVFTNHGLDPVRSDTIVDSILDWRDGDDLHRINGAESDYYQSLSQPYTAKNGRFDTVEELLWVRGMTPEIFYGAAGRAGIGNSFSIDNPSDRLNLRTASAETIRLFLGLPIEQARRFVEERKKVSEKTQEEMIRLLGIGSEESAGRRLAFTIPQVVTIRASGYRTPGSAGRTLKGVVRFGAAGRGFQLVRWVDRSS
jgi:general secretion pathway protein K